MFCAGCGTQIQTGLNYCSRCGRRVVADSKSGHNWANPMVIAGQTAGVGFIGYIFVLLILSRSGVSPDVFKVVTGFYFAALFALCFMFLRQGASSQSPPASLPVEQQPADLAYIRPATTAQLPEGFDEPASVTDHTTRTLDKAPIRKASL